MCTAIVTDGTFEGFLSSMFILMADQFKRRVKPSVKSLTENYQLFAPKCFQIWNNGQERGMAPLIPGMISEYSAFPL